MNTIQKINQINQKELENNVSDSASWHNDYRDTSYIFIGNLPFDLKEQDIVIIFSQYGIPTHINLIKDTETGKSRGFCYLKYEDHRSCVLAIDNFNGTKLFERPLKVDHVYYKLRDGQKEDDFLVDYSMCNKIIEKRIEDVKSSNKRNKESVLLEYKNSNDIKTSVTGSGDSTVNTLEDDDEFKDPMAEYLAKKKDIVKDDEFEDPMADYLTKKSDTVKDDEFEDPMADFLSKKKDTKKHESSATLNGSKKRKRIEFKSPKTSGEKKKSRI